MTKHTVAEARELAGLLKTAQDHCAFALETLNNAFFAEIKGMDPDGPLSADATEITQMMESIQITYKHMYAFGNRLKQEAVEADSDTLGPAV